MMSGDFCQFLIKASECHLGVILPSDVGDGIVGIDDAKTFQNSHDKFVLYSYLDENNKLKFTSVCPVDYNGTIVIFTKSNQSATGNNFRDGVQITSVCGNPALALYQSLSHVFNPLLNSASVTKSVHRHLANLQADLRSVLVSSQKGSDSESLIIVESLQHELEYWDSLSRSSKNRLQKTSAASFSDILRPLAKDFSVIEALPLTEVSDLLENAHNVLDDLWRHEPPFPKDRIVRLMDIIGYDVGKSVSKQIKECDIWSDNYSAVSELLNQCIEVSERWLKSCKELTTIFWQNYGEQRWKEPAYQPEELLKLVERLNEILNNHTLLKQLTRLLNRDEQAELRTNEMFEPFKQVEILEFGQYSTNLWQQACKKFEHMVRPAEERVGIKLKDQLSRIKANARQLLYEFTRYAEIINRPSLKQTLLTERQQLLTSLLEYVRQLQATPTAELNAGGKYTTSQIVAEVILARQLESRALEIQKTSSRLLSDLNGYENLAQSVNELLKDMKQQHTELYDSWTNEILALIDSGVLNLKDSDAVVQFSSNKLMKVNYSERLVGLIGEVRQFRALGYHIPSKIEQTSEQAKKFMRQAMILEQIANFHNTIGDRMITPQRPMMLASALALAKLVQQEEVVSWGDTKSVEKYVETLKNAVEKLSRENNLLASYYYQIADKIRALEDVDLIREYSKWKEAVRQIRKILEQVEEKGFKNMQTWKADIDTNLCKVLEKQYLKSLGSLHLYLPEIYTDIVYRKGELQFSPDSEALKQKYEQSLKKFLDIPKTFKGVDELPEVYSKILDNNQTELEKVTKQTDDLFQQLQSVLKHWQSWLQLDNLDVSKLSEWQHWELQFKSSKMFGHEIAKLPSQEERVGCFLIGLSRLRSDLESHNRSYWDQLVSSLKDSIAEDVVKLQNYVDPSTAVLTRQAVTVEEVGESGAAHANILKQKNEMEACFNQMVQKGKILMSWSREEIDAVNRLKGAWERLQSLLENHQHIIAKQMETIKTTLNIESENLEKDIERFAAKWEQTKPKENTGQIAELSLIELHHRFESIKEKISQWNEILEKKTKLEADYDKFNLEKIEFLSISTIENDLKKEENSWALFEEFYNQLDEIRKEEWIVFRKKIFRLEDFLSDWQTRLKNSETNLELVTRILQETHKYEDVIPCLKYVRGEDFTDKHWMDVFNILKIPSKPIDLLIVQDFLDVSDVLAENLKELQAICKKAASEILVRQALAELDQWDVQARFILQAHADSRKANTMLIKDFKEILNKIGDNQSLLQSVKNSADYDSFAERAGIWENKLATLDQNLTLLAQIQRKWIYLEPIFGSGTLIQEKQRFDKIDTDFNHILIYIEKDPRVSSLYRYPNLSLILKNLQDQLARCQKSLDNFLQEKRSKFPRFLFLGDDDLLEVVGQSSKEQVIQTHLKKLFAGINTIQLDSSAEKITAMCSLQGETVNLATPIPINRPVEDWLNALVKEMQTTLKDLLVQCLNQGQSADPLKYPSQILCLSDNITFTQKTEQAITSMTLPPLLAYYKSQLTHYSSLELNLTNEELQSLPSESEDYENILELKLKALLLDTIHHINIVEELLDANVMKLNDWTWQKQLRFYSNSMGEVTIKMANARMEYAYEYLGNAQKLVRTSLTERCFLTLTQGMYLGMGGNPYGPAGTGKTESVKALGHLLGRQVLVFNCDEGIDASSMGRILSGLVQSGAWGCFDEFNRLDEATLSAVSMQIQPIQEALRLHKDKLTLLEQKIDVNKHCGIFVTLNPAGGGYGGRNKLPDNLKQLFRPVLMTHPNNEEISRTLLHCAGYQNADVIGKKLIETFDSCSTLLSRQQHYDWGLRALRTILSGCARALKLHRKQTEEAEGNQYLTELDLVVKVLRIDTLSKLTFSDGKKFDALIRDIFKDVDIKTMGNELLIKALEETCTELKLSINKDQINKCLELHEQLKQRMGVALVGPPSSGKTTIRQLLLGALQKLGKTVKQHVFNPKSMPKNQLLGQIDFDTRQWNDGVLTLYSLQVVGEPSNVCSWIVCDGNIDPEWVEALNSVLDDNRLLSLPSGWRIQFGPNVNFIFETHDLSYASPATISRMGIVFLSENNLDLKSFVVNYVRTDLEYSSVFVGDTFVKCINWICEDGELTVKSSKIAVAKTALSLLKHVNSKNGFLVALVNGLGQELEIDFREVFTQQVFEWFEENPPGILNRIRYNKERDFIDSYYTNTNVNLDNVDQKIPLIPTGDVERTLDVLKLWIQPGEEQNFLLVGPHGSAKSLILKELILKERPNMEMCTIYCSANLSPNYVINKIAQLCIVVNTNKGKVYKPKRGNLILYFKNLHLLKQDQWGSNILIEFLHQMITYKAFFDSNLELIGYENITIVGSLSAETMDLSTRFTSILHVYNVNLPDPEDLAVIIVAYLSAIIKECFGNWPKAKIVKLATTMIAIYDKIRQIFTQALYKHYAFSPHDLTNWCSTLLRYAECLHGADEAEIFEIVAYECLKLFADKLVDKNDSEKLASLLNETFKLHWGINNVIKRNVYYVAPPQFSNKNSICPLIKWNDEEWSETVKRGIIQYEREGLKLDILINRELLELTASASKTLSAPEGHMVLVGQAGVGRKSSIRIISALQSARLITPSFNTMQQFNIDMKLAMQLAGLDGQQVYLLLEDQILQEKNILSTINILISAGEVPNLYNQPEIESLVAALRDDANRLNFDGNLIDFFAENVLKNLHVIVCLDVDNENIWRIFEQCPALMHKSVITWKTEWSQETIESIPIALINQFNEKQKDASATIMQCSNFPRLFHVIEEKFSAPYKFIAMIKLYIEIFNEKKQLIEQRKSKLQAGVSKLTDAAELVAKLRQKASEQQVKLGEKQAKANQALDMISNTMKNANNQKEEMQVLKEKTESENRQLVQRKKQIEMELAEVEPLIQEARSAVGNIRPESLSEIRSLRAPPDVIRDILEGVLRLMGIQDTSWNSMKTFLAKRGIKEEIRSFDASRIQSENRQAVEKLMSNKPDSFDAKSAKRASVAAAPLAAWVAANVKYSHVVDKIRPLEREQHKLKENLTSAENQLGELSAGLLDVDANVAELKKQLSAYTKEAAEIEIDLNRAQETLAAAEGLVSKLDDEYKRWQEQLKELSTEIDKLPDNCSLAAAFITYLSQENEDGRKMVLNAWLKILGIEKFSLEEFLGSEREQMQWQSEGLTCDKLSVQNAIIILKSKIVPVLIDPTSTALNWFKNHFKNRQTEVVTQNSGKFHTNLELAIRFGKLLIIEEVEHVSAALLPILRQQFIFQGERKLIHLNGKLIDYHNNFALILSSRNEHLEISADFSAILTTMNFTVTHAGLTEQLLSCAIRQENAELEERRRELLRSREELQEKQHQLQNRLLEDLASSSGDILQNTNLLTSLNETKASSSAITEALEESLQIQTKLEKEYEMYKEISTFGSFLYFACNEFTKFNVLYVLSVPACIKLFLTSLQTFQSMDNSIDAQKKHLFATIYNYMSRGIFKSDRLMFALSLTQKMFAIPPNEWSVLIGNILVSNRGDAENLPTWIPKQSINFVLTLQFACNDLYKTLNFEQFNLWARFMQTTNIEKDFPSHCKLSEFQKLLVVQALRPDQSFTAMTKCVLHLTGLRSIDPPVWDLQQIVKESSLDEPILLLTVSGSDPSNEIREIAKDNSEVVEVAMGEGQEDKAIKNLISTAQNGQWFIIKNLHLVPQWLAILSQNLQNLKMHSNFKLWLITEPNAKFNFVLAQTSLKVAYETPQGLKNNLQRTVMNSFGVKYFEKLSSPTSARIFFILCCIHAILQERRNYIPQGWTKWYEFSDSDLTTAVRLAEDLWQVSSAPIPWNFISGLCCDAVYGGRIENIADMDTLKSYLREYLVEDVLSHRWTLFGTKSTLPGSVKFYDYANLIKQLPDRDNSSVFGLPANIDRAWEKQMSLKIVGNLKNLLLCKNVQMKFARDIWQKNLSPLMQLWKKLNQGHDFVRMAAPPFDLSLSPIKMFIFEEMFNAIHLIQSIHKNFSALNKVCKGNAAPEQNDMEIGTCLINFTVPKQWQQKWQDGPKDPNKFLRSLIAKTINIAKLREAKFEQIVQQPMNLSIFLNPRAFLTSYKQEYAKIVNMAMDQLDLETTWRVPHQKNYIVLSDLLVEGGYFDDGNELRVCTEQTENINAAPNCYICWRDNKTGIKEEKYLQVPLYYTSSRENQLVCLKIPSEPKHKDKWIQAGLGFYLEY